MARRCRQGAKGGRSASCAWRDHGRRADARIGGAEGARTKPAQMDAAALLDKCGWKKCPNRHTRDGNRVWLYHVADQPCPACAERWAVAPQVAPTRERDREKKVVQVGQVGHDGGITGENVSNLPRARLDRLDNARGRQAGARGPSRLGPLRRGCHPASARSREPANNKGSARANGKGARRHAEEHGR